MICEDSRRRNECLRDCLGIHRPFRFNVFAAGDKPLIEISRPAACHACTCIPFALPRITVTMNDWQVGTVTQPWLGGGLTPTYIIRSQEGRAVLKMVGQFSTNPAAPCRFQLLQRRAGTGPWLPVGSLRRTQHVMRNRMATDADEFLLEFPAALPMETKATLIGAALFVDFTQFEGRAAAATLGEVVMEGRGGPESAPLHVGVEDQSWFPLCGWRNLYCCGCILRC